MYLINFYVPAEYLEQVKETLFNAGAGKIGDYAKCCWQICGEGQFLPLNQSQPFIGEQGIISTVIEYKVEMVCEDNLVKTVVETLKQAHPYEEPAYQVIRCEAF